MPVVILVLAIFGLLIFKTHEKSVARFLQNSGAETSHASGAGHAISAATSSSEKRIRNICSNNCRPGKDRNAGGTVETVLTGLSYNNPSLPGYFSLFTPAIHAPVTGDARAE